jgi:four helix bundle protein
MNAKAEEFKARAKTFATAIVELCGRVQKTQAGATMTQQLIEAATALHANYRAACRARSRREFIAKVGIAREEADECAGWLELLVSTRLLTPEEVGKLLTEANELTAILTASMVTAKRRGAAPDAPRSSVK